MKPKYILHKLPEGFIVTSDTLPKDFYNCLMLCTITNKLVNSVGASHIGYFKKVIAQQDQIDFSALTEEEQKEIGWFDVEKLSLKEFMFPEKLFYSMKNSSQNEYLLEEEYGKQNTVVYFQCIAFIKSFQKAQELLSDRRFTLEDLEDAIDNARMLSHIANCEDGGHRILYSKTEEQIIQSTSQKSWKIELEMELNLNGRNGLERASFIPKLTNDKIKILKLC